MKIFIQARKDGYNVLFPTPTTPTEFYKFASDIQSASAKNDAIYYGKNLYTLAFASGGCIFTKYVIGYDVQRNNLGNVGISVFIPNTQKLSGNDVKLLLDDLLNTYCRNYCPDNNISDKREDWLLFTTLADTYDAKLLSCTSNYENVTPGTQDPAFHYYKSDSELIEHLDKPFQEEYSDYKQILFIDSNLQGNANPLNVLKNSGVEVNSDLKNEYYYLNNYSPSKGVTITANGKSRSDGKNNNYIRAKWNVVIEYTKNYYKPIKAEGTISNLASDIYNYLEIKGNQILIKYNAFVPDPQTKKITFEVQDWKENLINDSEITYKNINNQISKRAYNNQIVFRGEELKEQWLVKVQKDDFSGEKRFTPENENESVEIKVNRQIIIPINVEDESQNKLTNFEVWTTLTNGYQIRDTIEFVDEQINGSYTVTIRKKGYEEENIKNFNPNTRRSIDVTLKEQKTNQTPGGPGLREHEPEKQRSFAAKTFFSKPAVIVGSIVVILLLGIGIFSYLSRKNVDPKIHLNIDKIKKYVEGNILNLDSLNDYKSQLQKEENDFIKKSGGGIFGGEENADSAKWKSDWQPAYDSLEQAIRKRTLINNKNFAELKNLNYSPSQQTYKTTIERIDSTKYADVGEELGDVSALNLKQIVEKINKILKPREPAIEETPQEPEMEENNTEHKEETPKKNEQPKKQPNPQEQKNAATDNTSDIIQYIKGSELDEAKLSEYKKTKGINQNIKNSIQLCLDFWALDGSGSGNNAKTYWKFRNKVNADPNFNNSKLKAFLDKMMQEGAKISYSKQDKIRGLK
jgi:hypothetical protein